MHKGTAMRIGAGLTSLLAATACAVAQSAEEYRAALQTVSAGVLGIQDTASITVSDETRAGAKWTWKASASGKSWTCDADDQMRLPSCVQES